MDSTKKADALLEHGGPASVHRLTRVYPTDHQAAFVLGGKDLTLGRASGPGRLALDDSEVSRAHAELLYAKAYDRYRVRDLGSTNGTFLDGHQLTDLALLADGALLRVGETLFVYEREEPELSAEAIARCPAELALSYYVAREKADLAARTDDPILILGATGVGKEVLAKRVHMMSDRSGPFVAVNCATMTRELIASELFGYKKGAFSGANQDRRGLFASAEGGTLFLDEVAELPLDQQPTLLRALQERSVRPVGADREIPVDVRLVSATHQDLAALDQEGSFRADLFARLAGFDVQLPKLTQRRVEILPLFAEFAQGAPPLSRAAAEALLRHAWPQNIRELKRTAAQVALYAGDVPKVEPINLPKKLRDAPQDRLQNEPRVQKPRGRAERPSKSELVEALRTNDGNVSAVARKLKAHRNQVMRWFAWYGLEPEDFR